MMLPYMLDLFAQTVAPAPPAPNSIEAWAPTGVMGTLLLALLALVRQMITTFKDEQGAERKAAELRWSEILKTFKEDQAAERKRSDDMLDKERLRSDANATRMWATFEQFRESFTCRFSGQCQYQQPIRRPPESQEK